MRRRFRMGLRPWLVAAVTGSLVLLAAAHAPRAAEPQIQARLFKLEHQTSNDVFDAIKNLGSGKKGTKLDETSAFESIAVRDYPANVAAIARAIKLLDVPTPEVELRLHILIASPSGNDKVPASLTRVVSQLKKSLKYQAYYEIAGMFQRVKSGAWARSKGKARIDASIGGESSRTDYHYKFKASVETGKRPRSVVIRSLDFDADNKTLGNVDINTDFTVREGETVVVGTATVDRDRALILLVSARIF